MSKLPITSLTAAILALVFVILSIRVVRGRLSTKTSLGDGAAGSVASGAEVGASSLVVALRAHGNFAEYVPLSLLLLGLIEAHGTSRTAVMGLAAMLVVARIAHPFGLARRTPNLPRAAGFMLNVAMLAGGALYLAYLTLA